MSITRDEYQLALLSVWFGRRLTLDQALTVCPHLTRDQVVSTLTGTERAYIALPPTSVRDTCYVLIYQPPIRRIGVTGGIWIETKCYRTARRSRISPDYRKVDSCEHPFTAEALAFAEQQWPEALIDDSWADFLIVHMEDPTGSGDPRKVHEIGVALNRPAAEVFDYESGIPDPRIRKWNNATGLATLDPLLIIELRGDQFPEQRIFNCSHCGGGLGDSQCAGCKASYPRHGYTTEVVSLPPKLIALLRENGHEFGLQPERLLVR